MSTFAEDRFNEQFEQGMIDQFECIRDSELAQGYQYLEDLYYKMCDTCKKQLDAVVEEHPYISDHERRYSIMLKKRYDHYMGTTAGTAGTAWDSSQTAKLKEMWTLMVLVDFAPVLEVVTVRQKRLVRFLFFLRVYTLNSNTYTYTYTHSTLHRKQKEKIV